MDEFQDTNELQCAILAGLGADRVLMVGDERQSIYRFRGADVEVFKKRRAALASGEGRGQPGGLHRLDVNYRSAPEILDFINSLFSHESFFGEEFALLGGRPRPGARAARRARRRRGRRRPPRVEVLVAERRREGEGDGRLVPMQQAEAEALAAHVRGLLDQEGWRQRDIVVLLPTQTQVELLPGRAGGPGRRGVLWCAARATTRKRKSPTSSVCLRLLLNPHDDLALVTVLRSPLVGLSDDGLYLLGRERRSSAGPGRCGKWCAARQVEALDTRPTGRRSRCSCERLAADQTRVGRPGLARLIDDAISAFSYDLCLLAAPEGGRRFANVRKLMRLAEEFELASGPDLAAFVSVVKSTGQVSDREGSAPTLGEGDDVVRVMTVHQAKGLEFPVVVLAGLGADAHRPETSTFAVGQRRSGGGVPQGLPQPHLRSARPLLGPGRGDRRRGSGAGSKKRTCGCSMSP